MTVLTIREFLDLPPEALPSAGWSRDVDADMGDAWPYLRDAVLPEPEQRMNHLRLPILLKADRDDWRNGRIVEC